jgi:hypothetical protein
MLEMTTGVIKLLRLDYSLHIAISIMRILIACFAVIYTFIPHKRAMYYHFYVKYLSFVFYKTLEPSTFSLSVIKFRWKI